MDGKKVEDYPGHESSKEFIHRKFEDRMVEFAKKIAENKKHAKELTAKKNLSKEDVKELDWMMDWITREVASNIPFFAKCFRETMDKVVLDAKTEVDNAILHKITTLGLNALHEQNKLLTDNNE